MRILMLLQNQVGKGTYWRVLYLARALARSGHTLTVLATSKQRRLGFASRPDLQAGVTVVEAPDLLWGSLRSGWDAWGVAARIGWSRKQAFDLIHAFESRPVVILPALYWQRFRRTKLILDWCDWFGKGGSVEERPNPLVRSVLRPVETFFESRFRSQADGTTVINSFLRSQALALGIASKRILDLPNGCNVEELHPIPKTEARRALGWHQEIPVLGYIGTLFLQDARLMAQAFDLICKAHPKTNLLLAGYCNQAVEKMVDRPEAVLRSGLVTMEEINLYLSACDICWLPLKDSGANQGRTPLKLNDYMAVGRPVVATAVGEVASLIQEGRFGLLAKDTPEDLAGQTSKLMENLDLVEEMGLRARRLAEKKFTWSLMGKRLEKFYEQILGGRWN